MIPLADEARWIRQYYLSKNLTLPGKIEQIFFLRKLHDK